MRKKYGFLFIFLVLTIAMMSIVTATEVNDTTVATSTQTAPVVQDNMANSPTITEDTKENIVDENVIADAGDKQVKEIIKQDNKVFKDNIKTDINSSETTTVNITTQAEFKKYFTIMSNNAYMGKGITNTSNNLVLNVKYVPNNVNMLSFDENSQKFQNLSLVIDGNGCGALTDVGFKISTNFKTVTLQNFDSTITQSYSNNDYLTLTGTNGTYIIRNVSIDVQKRDLTTYVFKVEKQSIIENCNLKACLCECNINWDSYPYLPDCIGLYVTSKSVIRNNHIEILVTGNNGGSYYSSFAVFLGTSGITFVNNTLISTNCTDDSGYSYGLVIRSSDNVILDNHIYITSHTYTAGIHLELATFKNNIVQGNYINVTSSYGKAPWGNIAVAYGINLLDFQYTGSIFSTGGNHPNNNTFKENIIVGSAAQIYGVEMYGGYNNNFTDNNITLFGRTCMGIGVIGANTITSNNNIYVLGEHNLTEGTADYLKAKTTGLYTYYTESGIVFKDNTIYSENGPGIIIENACNVVAENNNIITEGHDYTITLEGTSEANNVINNILEARDHYGDDSVTGPLSNNTVENNTYMTEAVITVTVPENVIVGLETPITVKITDDKNNPARDKQVVVQVNNDESHTYTTDDEGTLTINYTPNSTGICPIRITTPPERNLLETTITTTFVVEKIDTEVTVNYIGPIKYYDNVTITGTLKDIYDKAIEDSIILTFNGLEETITTDSEGEYTYTIIAKTIGTNNITVSYQGNDICNPTSTTTTFNTVAKDTLITIDDIADTPYTDTITIKGKFVTENGVALKNSVVAVTINGVKTGVRTDNKGVFAHGYKTKHVGVNNVTVSYAGNVKYAATSTSATFNVVAKDTVIVIDDIGDAHYTDTAIITGTFITDSGVALKNSVVAVTINGVKTGVRTDNNGVFTYSYKTKTAGLNNVTVSYAGNAKYAATSTSATFNVVAKDTVIVIDDIAQTKLSDIAVITGRFTTDSGVALKTSTLTLNVNGAKVSVKTDNNGVFTYSYKTKTVGVNNVTVSYAGNIRYAATNTNTTFTVVKS